MLDILNSKDNKIIIISTEDYEIKEKLENIQVGNKRLGPTLSGKIYKFFTAKNKDIKINN